MHKPPYQGVLVGPVWSHNADDGSITLLTPMTREIETGSVASVRDPLFHQKKRNGLDWHNFSYEYFHEVRDQGIYGGTSLDTGLFGGKTGYVYDSISGFASPIEMATPIDGVQREALSGLLDKIKNQKVNLGQAFGERIQTVNMLTQSINRLASAARAIRRGRLDHAVRLFDMSVGTKHATRVPLNLRKRVKESKDNLANYWLEYTYGWKPLLMDIYGAAKAIADSFVDPLTGDPTIVCKADSRKSSEELFKGTSFENGFSNGGNYWNYKESFDCLNRTEYRYLVEYTYDDEFAHQMSSLGISNPISLAWELLPYSFVLDWVLPIGDYLGQLDATKGLRFRRGSVSYRITSNAQTIWTYNRSRADFPYVSGCGRTLLYEKKNRSILSGFPGPELPMLSPKIGVSRAISGLALLNQAFKR